jgi:hypothetical protein
VLTSSISKTVDLRRVFINGTSSGTGCTGF